jgi:protein-cysteine N-palmitoyltransferase HHAT
MFIPPNSHAPKTVKYAELMISLILGTGPLLYALIKGCYNSLELSKHNQIVGITRSNWNTNWKIDLSDYQYRELRENLLLIIFVAFTFVTIKKIINLYSDSIRLKIYYYLLAGLGLIVYIHGLGGIVLLSIIALNYILCVIAVSYSHFPIIVWVFNFSLLILSKTSYADFWNKDCFISWNSNFNLVVLKIISFMIDYHWSTSGKLVEPLLEHSSKCSDCKKQAPCLKYRMQGHATDYSLIAFVSYCTYFPLYLSGPTTSYNAWISQVYLPKSLIPTKFIVQYAVRVGIVWVLLEVLIHVSFFPAIVSRDINSDIWKKFNITELLFASYCLLNFIWLKFTFIWRFFRMWSLIDGIECPENMGKCMTNSYCFIEFWKNWHKAFNLWLVRYLYIPLGGNKWKIVNIWIVFGFVALWHDLSLNLLAWGWGMCLFIMPEVMLQNYFSQEKFYELRQTLLYCWICGIAGGFDTILMAIANLVGFSFGIDGLNIVLKSITASIVMQIVIVFIFHTLNLRLIERLRSNHRKVA